MTAVASIRRWTLVLTAALLALIAVLLLILRLAFSHADHLIPHIESLLEARIGAPVSIDHLAVSLERNDLVVRLEGLEARTGQQPLVSLSSAYLRLDGWASIREFAPIFSDVRLADFDFHLYQRDETTWAWPEPATLGLLAREPEVDLNRIDRWTELLLRQRLWMRESQVTFHGDEGSLSLTAPRLLLAGNSELARFEGAVNIVDDATLARENGPPALIVQAEMQPGAAGPGDFSAVVQAELQLDYLVALSDMFRADHMPYIEQADGSVRFWGEWFGGRLHQVRTGVDIPQLTLSHQARFAVLRRIEANGQWEREGEGGQAWLSANAESVESAQPENVSEGPALPRHWYLSHQPGRWALRTSAFELASLTAWRDYVFLPESVSRVLQTLSPSGQVEGLALGQQNGDWVVDAALINASARPWRQAPGGGPLDAWVEARNSRGRVRFASPGESALLFPELFTEPMQLQSAEGIVEWVYDGPDTMVSGRDIRIDWDGADITGGFGLVNGQGRGQFGLHIDFANVDAVDQPLTQWLPVKVLGPGLREWLANDIGGFVPQGSLRLGLPIGENRAGNPARLALSLDVERGYLPIADGWPLLEDVEGTLGFRNQVLTARVERARSLGVNARRGEVRLEGQALTLDGQLASDANGLIDFIQAIPNVDTSFLDAIEASGEVDGEFRAALSLDDPDALELEINARPRFSQVRYTPFEKAPLTGVRGDVTWQQRGERFALTGRADGQLLEGPIAAQFDVPGEGITLGGVLDTGALFTLAGVASEPARALVSGRADWEGQVQLEPTPHLWFESDLVGVASTLPGPLDKPAGTPWPLRLEADIERGMLEARLSDVLDTRLLIGDSVEGVLALGRAAPLSASPAGPGLRFVADVGRFDVLAWQRAIASLAEGGGETAPGEFPPLEEPVSLMFDTPCLAFGAECLGELSLSAQLADRALDARVGGDIVSGRLAYRQGAERPLDITVAALDADRLGGFLPRDDDTPAPSSWMAAVETSRPEPITAPAWLERVPSGRLRLAEVTLGESRIGPLTAYWQTGPSWLSLSPVGLTLDEISLSGDLIWQGRESTADIAMRGGDMGRALERLGQPVPIRSRTARANARFVWPGAPWQIDLARASGRLDVDVRDGRFLSMNSPSARLVGLLNFDNVLRRLRLDFTDVTGQGTAFDRIQGSATVAGGRVTLREPLQIEAPAATLSLTGHVNLLERELDQRLGVTLPVSQTLPLAALAVGEPIIGAALLVSDQLFGDSLNRAATLHFRVQGPWTSPRVTLEGP